jgi:DNA-binding LacI/PurR family transcriptional regulator
METRKIRNMEEFASVSGISRPTLSKYFNNAESVRASTRQKIEAALERYDYRPNVYATNQNRRTTRNIGIVLPYLADPFFNEIGRAVEQACLGAGYSPILLSSHGDLAQENANLESLRGLKPAGVLLAPFGRNSDRSTIQVFGEDIPLVLFDADVEGAGEAFIGTDNAQSMALIVDYLCRSGEPPCFFEMQTPSNPNATRRREAYQESMGRLGQEARIFQASGTGWDFEDIGCREGGALLDRSAFPTNTILCSNDRLAIGFLAAAYERGIRVGREQDCRLRIAGHDDHPFSRFTCPSLTTISQDYAAIAERAVTTLLDVIDAGKQEADRKVTLFDGKLVLRNSA